MVEFSPCTGGDSGSQSLASSDVGRIGGEEVLGNVLKWQGRMVAEGSRSSTIILRITQQISYPTLGDSYWTYDLFIITTRSHHCYCTCCRRWKPPLYQAKSSNSDRSLEVRPSSPPRSNSESNSPPSKKVQQNLTFAQTHQASRQPHQRLSRTSRRLQHHIRPIRVPVALPYTATVTQITHFLGTSRPRAVAVLDSTPSTSSA